MRLGKKAAAVVFFSLVSLLSFYKNNLMSTNAHSKPEWKTVNYVYGAERTASGTIPCAVAIVV